MLAELALEAPTATTCTRVEGGYRPYERFGYVSSEGWMMAVGYSWTWKPPRGGSVVEGYLVGRGRSRARMPCANRPAEWGWAVVAPSPALARATLGLPSPSPFWLGLCCGASCVWQFGPSATTRQQRGGATLGASSQSNCRSRKTLRLRPMSNRPGRCARSASFFEVPTTGYLERRGLSRTFFLDFDFSEGVGGSSTRWAAARALAFWIALAMASASALVAFSFAST